MIRRVQLMVTCMTAMVECLVDANRTGQVLASQSAGVRVLTSVSRVNISFGNKTTSPGVDLEDEEVACSKSARIFCKSFKNITMNNTIGVSRKNDHTKVENEHVFEVVDIPFEEDLVTVSTSNKLNSTVPIKSRKLKIQDEKSELQDLETLKVAAALDNSENSKDLFRKVKLHSDSVGFRSPLKQISNQLSSSGKK